MRAAAVAAAALLTASCALSFPDKVPGDTSTTDSTGEPDTEQDSPPDTQPDTSPDSEPDTPADTPVEPGCGNGTRETSLGEECDEGSSNCNEPGCTCTTDCRKPWILENETGTITALQDVWTNGTEAIAVGQSGVVLHRDSTSGAWTAGSSGTGNDLMALFALSSTVVIDILAAGHNDTVIRWNGTSWRPEPALDPPDPPGPLDYTDLTCWWTSPLMCFLTTREGSILTYSSGWSSWSPTGASDWNAVGHALPSTTLYGYAAGNGGQFTFYTPTPAPPHWIDSETPISSFNIYDIWVAGLNDFYVVADSGRIHHFDGFEWDQMETPTSEPLYAIAGTGTYLFAVGGNGTILRHSGSLDDPWVEEPSLTTRSLRGVAASPTLVIAVGQFGVVLRRQP